MIDWKDALAQLKDSDAIPHVDESPVDEMASAVSTPQAKGGKKGKINIFVEKKGRKGKTATIAVGFECDDDELAEIASGAKRHLGSGGSSRCGEILIQGECRERFAAWLRSQGYKV